MSFFQALILGIVQGLTEFLPISSSGHLVILPELFGWEGHSLVFDTTLHLGTALALIVYFWKDLVEISQGFLGDFFKKGLNYKAYSEKGFFCAKILVGSIPAGVIGFLFEDFFEIYFREVRTVAGFLLVGSVLMFLAEKLGNRKKEKVSLAGSFVVGLFQSLALFPGVSRSGATISGGMFFGLKREEAARFSFLLSVPIVVVAGLYKVLTSFYLVSGSFAVLFVGFLTSFVIGMVAIRFLLGFLGNNSLKPFIVYRVLMVVLFLLV
jgi:undecaprenyl-diphosphatase